MSIETKQLIADAEDVARRLEAASDFWPASDIRFDAFRLLRKLSAAIAPSDAAQAPMAKIDSAEFAQLQTYLKEHHANVRPAHTAGLAAWALGALRFARQAAFNEAASVDAKVIASLMAAGKVTREDVDAALAKVAAQPTAAPVAAQAPVGWKLVPVKPTEEMIRAADSTGFYDHKEAFHISPCAAYKAMLDAAPVAAQAPAQQAVTLTDDARDAARYRWLRSRPESVEPDRIDVVHWSALDESANEGEGLRGDALDAAIDAARKGASE